MHFGTLANLMVFASFSIKVNEIGSTANAAVLCSVSIQDCKVFRMGIQPHIQTKGRKWIPRKSPYNLKIFVKKIGKEIIVTE